LSVVAVPVYKGYTKKAMATEGKALLGAINTSQKVYFAEWAMFVNSGQSSVLDVNASTNKYFKTYTLSGNATGFTASTAGETGGGAQGITLSLTGSSNGASAITEIGL